MATTTSIPLSYKNSIQANVCSNRNIEKNKNKKYKNKIIYIIYLERVYNHTCILIKCHNST